MQPAADPQRRRADDVLARLDDAGVVALRLPTLLGVGPVTVYLVRGTPRTLVDTGPSMLPTLEALEAGLAAHGVRVEDLERIVVTHHHPDHFGLAGRLRARSGAEVAAPAVAAEYLADHPRSRRRDRAFRTAAFLAHGVPADVVPALDEVMAARSAWGDSTPVDRPLRQGDRIAVGELVTVVHERPGHSESDLVLHDEAGGLLFGGDHLLPYISSNAVLARPLAAGADGDVTRNAALRTYAASLAATRAMDVRVVLPGHGGPFADHRPLVDERLRAMRTRADEILALLDDAPRSAFDVARAIWPALAMPQASLTVSEVLGHVELLLSDGRAVRARGDDGVVRFARA